MPWQAAGRRAAGQRRISADTALRLARYFGTSERFWMNLQARYDLEVEKDRIGGVVSPATCRLSSRAHAVRSQMVPRTAGRA